MDSLGNKGAISAGESQWMTAGSGILHQEMPVCLGTYAGLPALAQSAARGKDGPARILSITQADIPVAESSFATVRVLSGEYGGVSGVTPRHIPACILDISLPRGKSLTLPAKHEETVFVFLMEGDAVIGAHLIREKTAVLFGAGDTVSFEAQPDGDVRLIYFSGKALHVPIAWGGPIVMNTREELNLAFDELRQGTFIKNKI